MEFHSQGIDVIVPVYGAAEALARCVAGLLAHTDLAANRLVFVLDGEQPPQVEQSLAAISSPGVTVLRQSERRGFVAAANRGMSFSNRNVVLLNSDTVVTSRWLEKLDAAAHSSPDIATVTPFSNSATICSLPRWLETNLLPAGYDLDSFARLVEERSQRIYPRLPTGIGVCLYIRRQVLAEVGLFDERAFGLGYGEESDFCMRAAQAGYTHALDDATFIYHEGQASFGASHPGRVRAAHRVLRLRHPGYLRRVGRFIREDPLRPLRQRVIDALSLPRAAARRPQPARVLHLVHGWPPWSQAGTEMYAAWLVRRQAREREVTVYARISDPRRRQGSALELLDRGARVRLLVNNFRQRDPFSRNALRDRRLERDFTEVLDDFRPNLLHVHHLAGHCATLPRIALRREIPVIFQLQDWWAACARSNLLDRDGRLCSGPGLGKCTRCLPLTGLPPRQLLNRLLYAYRGRLLRRLLRRADARIAGSRFIRDSFRSLGLLSEDDPVDVVPYGVERSFLRGAHVERNPGPAQPLRLGFIGALLQHKGLHAATAALSEFTAQEVTLDVWGDGSLAPRYADEAAARAAPGIVRLHGPFAEGELSNLFAEIDLLVVPSLGLESFGLVVREAFAAGVPVLLSRRGALPEALEGHDCGAVFDPERPEELRGWIRRLIEDRDLLARWRRDLPPVKSADRHADEVEEIYQRTLADRRSRRG